jgi:hypothetical protein
MKSCLCRKSLRRGWKIMRPMGRLPCVTEHSVDGIGLAQDGVGPRSHRFGGATAILRDLLPGPVLLGHFSDCLLNKI